MNLLWTPGAWEDYLYWQRQDRRMLRRINELIRDAMRSPHEGLGKPEPLRGNWSGWWSRRIDREHRLVYRVGRDGQDTRLEIAACRYHY